MQLYLTGYYFLAPLFRFCFGTIAPVFNLKFAKIPYQKQKQKTHQRLAILFSFQNLLSIYRFRRLVRSNRALYRSCPKHTKLLVAKAIVQAVQQQEPPGDFIKLNGTDDNAWKPITYTQAVNKTSQALREKEPNNTNKKKQDLQLQLQQQQQHQYQTAQQESVDQDETNQKKNLETAEEAAKRMKVAGVQMSESIANLTNITIQSAGRLEKMSAPSKNKGERQQSQQPRNRNMGSSREQVLQQQANAMILGGDQQQDSTTTKKPRRIGKKRKIVDFVKPSWWGTGSTMNGMNAVNNITSNVSNGSTSTSTAASGTVVTPGMDTNFNNEDGNNKRMKVRNGVVGNADTNGRGGGHEVKNMGRGVVNQVKKTAASTTQTPIDETPFPMETTLGLRQSTMSRFLNNTTLFGRGTSVAPATAIGVANSSSATATGSFDIVGVNADPAQLQNDVVSQNPMSWPQQTASDRINNNLQYQQQEQRTSIPSFSSDHHMGRTSVQQLRSQQLQEQQSLLASGFENENKVATGIARFEKDLEEIPTSGLRILNGQHSMDGGDWRPKALKTQMSDWLNSFLPSSAKRDGGSHKYNHTNKNDSDWSSEDGIIDNEGAAIPPPPGGGAGLGRSVSSAIFGLVESPSLLLTSLKSGASSIFGDYIFPQAPVDAMPTPIRRFPSAFQQQQQQQFGGSGVTGGAMIGNHLVLGEPTKRRSSLLEDFEETPMEMELRNAKPEEHQRGPSRYC